MKKQNKWLSIIFALVMIFTFFIPNMLNANTFSNSINESYVSAISIKETITGLEPFDSNDNAGNDSSPTNNVVRSFDSISYTLEYITELKTNTPISDAYLMIEFVLPCTKDVATFDMSTMTWLENPILTENNGQQILTGRRHLKNTSSSTAVPGAGTLSIGIKVQGAMNGFKFVPEFNLYMEGNTFNERKNIKSQEITVSAAPKYNIIVQRNNSLDYLSYFNFNNSTYSQTKIENSNHGRLQGYSIALQLYNDNSSKGMKGIEIPKGNIEFDLTFSEATTTNGGTDVTFTEGYTPILWDYSENTGTTKGKLGRNTFFKNNSNYSSFLAPYNKGNGNNSCYDGGSWNLTKTGINTYHVTISDYKFSPEFNFPKRYAEEPETTSREIAHIGYFSTGYIEVLCQFPDSVENITSMYLTVETSNLKATTASNQQGVEMVASDNKNVSTITLYPPGSIIRTIEFRYKNGGAWLQTPYTSRGDTSLFQGEVFTVCANGNHRHDYNIYSYDMLLKFDPTAFEFDKSQTYWNAFTAWGSGSVGTLTYFYAAKPDKTGWTSFEEMRDTKQEGLIYFTDIDELNAQGYICIGFLAEGRNSNLDGGVTIYGNLKVKENANINTTYAFINDFRIWFENIDFSYGDLQYNHSTNSYPKQNASDKYVLGYPEPAMVSYTTAANNYVKTEYDENGKIIVGTHSGGYSMGNTILVIGYRSQVQQQITTKDASGKIKTSYDMDANERTINFKIIPKAESAMTTGQSTTNLYVVETLPKDLTYNQGSSYWGNQNHEPEVTINANGTTTLKWTLPNVSINAILPEITFGCTIGKAGTNQDVQNNQVITPTVRIYGDKDNREAILINGNYAETAFSIIKLNAISISKTTSTPYISLGQNFNFTLKYANNSENAIPNSKIYDILPYKGDARGSDFEGFYKINSITINFTNAPKTFTDFTSNNYVVGYTTTQNIPTNNFNAINSINNWVTITNKSINTTNKTITYTGLPEGVTGLVFNMKLEGLEYIEITLSMAPTGPQEEGDMYINGFYQYGQGQTEQVHSNHVAVQVYGHLDVTKIWQDDRNIYNTRPSTLDITVYQNGNEYRDITLTPNNAMANNSDKWAQRIDNVPLFDIQGNPYIYEIEEDLADINQNFYFDAIYDQDNLTVTNIGIWVKNNEYPEYMIIVNKDIINKNNQIATADDFNKIKLNNNQEFQIVLKQLSRTIINNGTTLSETYSGYSGNEYHGIVTDNNQLIFRNIPAGKYEISENIIQYFEFIGIEKIENSEHATFTVENGKYYITLSGLYENDEYVEVNVTNKINDFRPYDKSPSKDNLFNIS